MSFTDNRANSIMDCTNQDPPSDSDLVTLYIFCGVNVFVSLLLIALWTKKRNYFPIRERSPLLVIIFILGSLLYQISQPIALLYTLKSSSIPSGGIKWANLNALSKALSNSYFLGFSIMVCSYFIRALRLSYAFDPTREKKAADSLYSRQWLLSLIVLISSFLLFEASINLFITVPFFHRTADPDDFSQEILQTLLSEAGIFIQVGLFMCFAFLLRNVRADYNFNKEMIAVTSLDWFFQAACLIMYQNNLLHGCVGFFSKTMILYAARGLCFLAVTAVYPLFISVRGHFPLTPTKAMDEFRYFIMDELCVKTYMNFLKHLDATNDQTMLFEEISSRRSYNEIFLFFLDIHRVNILREDSPNTLTRMYACYVKDPENSQIFPQYLIQEITQIYESSNPEDLSVEIFRDLYQYAYNTLQTLYEKTYQRTDSFLALRERLRTYEFVNEKLCKLNMISNS